MDLRRHSLSAVVGGQKSLWRSPQGWTQAHLQVLCVDYQSHVFGHVDDLDRDDDDDTLSFHALIPSMLPFHLKLNVESLEAPSGPWAQEQALSNLLAFHPWSIEEMAKDADGKPTMPRHDGDVEAIPFSCERECRMQLMVGQRAYRLPPLCHFRLGSLLLPYFDSYALHNRWPPLSDADWAPFITGVLIGMAQANSHSFADESVVVVSPKPRALYDKYIYLYIYREKEGVCVCVREREGERERK